MDPRIDQGRHERNAEKSRRKHAERDRDHYKKERDDLLLKMAEAVDGEAQERDAAKKLWDAAVEDWDWPKENEPDSLQERLFDSPTIYPSIGLKGKELYRIGVALGFIEEME